MRKGWADGCRSGSNSFSPLLGPILKTPFVHQPEIGELSAAIATVRPPAVSVHDTYNNAWNIGYTVCRYYQSAVFEWLEFATLVAALLYVGLRERRFSS